MHVPLVVVIVGGIDRAAPVDGRRCANHRCGAVVVAEDRSAIFDRLDHRRPIDVRHFQIGRRPGLAAISVGNQILERRLPVEVVVWREAYLAVGLNLDRAVLGVSHLSNGERIAVRVRIVAEELRRVDDEGRVLVARKSIIDCYRSGVDLLQVDHRSRRGETSSAVRDRVGEVALRAGIAAITWIGQEGDRTVRVQAYRAVLRIGHAHNAQVGVRVIDVEVIGQQGRRRHGDGDTLAAIHDVVVGNRGVIDRGHVDRGGGGRCGTGGIAHLIGEGRVTKEVLIRHEADGAIRIQRYRAMRGTIDTGDRHRLMRVIHVRIVGQQRRRIDGQRRVFGTVDHVITQARRVVDRR
ncbi:hypothetical protein D9M72_474550 [compost metagenome]